MNESRSLNNGAKHNDFALVRKPPSAVEKAAPGAKYILSGMVGDTLDLARKTVSKEVRVEDTQFEKWFQIGEKYYYGQSVPQNFAEAVKWFRKAAEQNHTSAQYNLGICYANGRGVEKNYTQAVKWYRMAAEQRHAAAQNNLGSCYYNGTGVEKNYAEAVEWYRKSAEQNEARAQYNLGYCYYSGEGVEKDFPEAYKLYKLAGDQNLEIAVENFNQIVTWMTVSKIAEGERRYGEFNSRKNLSK